MAENKSHATRSALPPLLRRLREWSVFAHLSDSQFRRVAELLAITSAKPGENVVLQGFDRADLFIVRRGQAIGHRQLAANALEERGGVYAPGDFFNVKAFLTGGRSDERVHANTPCELWYIDREAFANLLKAQPDLEDRIAYPDEVKLIRAKHREYKWMKPGEEIEFEGRRHGWVLVVRLGIPMMIGQALIALVLYFWLPFGLIWAILILLVPILIWQYLDWQNDYFVVTDRRVVNREKVIFLSESTNELPIDRINNIKTSQTGIMASLMNYGDIEVEATGLDSGVSFDRLPQPQQVQFLINRQRDRAQADRASLDLSHIRKQIRVAIDMDPRQTPSDKKPPVPTSLWQRDWQNFKKTISEFRQTIVPYSKVTDSDGKAIIYRKHWFELARTAGIPSFVLLMTLALSFAVMYTHATTGLGLAWTSLCGGVSVIVLGMGIWWFYHYEDWRNDQYRLEEEKIIDLDVRPFWRGRIQRDVKYDRITNVNAEIKGFWNTIFQVGNVIIKTGGESDLIFQRVHNPTAVQSEISRRVDAARERRSETDKENRRRELSQWIGIYDEVAALKRNPPQ